ncbi:MAG: nicotinate-nucleotide adenylyltransferase [Thiobacillus sp.]
MQAIGIFGGTFDPIHYGHLRLAEEMAAALNLREVRFIPSGLPPHRAAPQTTALHRLEMVRRAITGNPCFVLDEREVQRTEQHARPSYTVDTLNELRAEVGPAQPLCLLLGADAFLGLPSWHEWRRLFELAHIIVAERPGTALQHALPQDLQAEVTKRWVEAADAHVGAAGKVLGLQMTPLAISARAIREALAAQKSVRYLLPDAVLDYLQQQQLYKSST